MDLRVVKTRKHILNSFVELLNEHDFPDISVKMITQKALINRSTFYRNYKDKYDLRDILIDDIVKNFTDNLEVDFLELHNLENERYFNLYGIHKEDLNNYDFILDTTNLSPKDVKDKIIKAYKEWLEK